MANTHYEFCFRQPILTPCSSVSVTVNVEDFNDHAPVFDATSYSATISEVRPGCRYRGIIY